MWNAYTTTNASLPSRDIRVKDLIVDGLINNYETFDATVTQENASTTVVEIAVLRIGDIIHLYIPQLTVTAATYSSAFKSIPIPLAYRPAAADQSQAIVTNQNNTPGVGSGYFESVSELRLYTKSDRTQPTNTFAATVRPTMFTYFKSL
jgi:hypothetical protein